MSRKLDLLVIVIIAIMTLVFYMSFCSQKHEDKNILPDSMPSQLKQEKQLEPVPEYTGLKPIELYW